MTARRPEINPDHSFEGPIRRHVLSRLVHRDTDRWYQGNRSLNLAFHRVREPVHDGFGRLERDTPNVSGDAGGQLVEAILRIREDWRSEDVPHAGPDQPPGLCQRERVGSDGVA